MRSRHTNTCSCAPNWWTSRLQTPPPHTRAGGEESLRFRFPFSSQAKRENGKGRCEDDLSVCPNHAAGQQHVRDHLHLPVCGPLYDAESRLILLRYQHLRLRLRLRLRLWNCFDVVLGFLFCRCLWWVVFVFGSRFGLGERWFPRAVKDVTQPAHLAARQP